MGIRLPNPRYIGDGLYARHDGQQFWIESSNGITVSQQVAMDGNTLSQLNDYAEYMAEFYNNNQHQVEPGCDDCGADPQTTKAPSWTPSRARSTASDTSNGTSRYDSAETAPKSSTNRTSISSSPSGQRNRHTQAGEAILMINQPAAVQPV